eukprot:scaffold9298_cov34-Tisochrysis_lutea.AAC.2
MSMPDFQTSMPSISAKHRPILWHYGAHAHRRKPPNDDPEPCLVRRSLRNELGTKAQISRAIF